MSELLPARRERSTSRRLFLGCTFGVGAALFLPGGAAAALRPLPAPARTLTVNHLHTGERLTATYWERGRYLEDGLAELNWILRDHRSGDVASIDRGLLDLLHRLNTKLGGGIDFQVVSAYRSRATNAMLAKVSTGVARKSLHMQGKAIDITVPGMRLGKLRKAAKALKAGGVGYYPQSGFVHVDVGEVRYW